MLSPALQSFHDNVYVLTIPSVGDRHENSRQQLGEGNFEFVFGVDARNITKEELIDSGLYDEDLARLTDRHHRVPKLGAICASLGHRQIYQRILDSGDRRALIFEDDAYAFDVSEVEVTLALDNIPEDADLIYWARVGGRYAPLLGEVQKIIFHLRRGFGKETFNHRMIRNIYMRNVNDYFDVAAVNFAGHAYTVTRRAAEALLKWQTPVTLPPDLAIIHATLNRDIRSYVVRQQLFGQRSYDSNDPMESLV